MHRAAEQRSQHDDAVLVFDFVPLLPAEDGARVDQDDALHMRIVVRIDEGATASNEIVPQGLGRDVARNEDLAAELFFHELEDTAKELLLVLEVMIQRALRDARCLRDVIEGGLAVPSRPEERAGRLDQRETRGVPLLDLLGSDLRTHSMDDTYCGYGCKGIQCQVEEIMPKFIIERKIPGAGSLSPEKLAESARKSTRLMRELGGEISWITSYITDDKVYCVFVAPDQDVILEHARCLDIPADRISQVRAMTDPSTGG